MMKHVEAERKLEADEKSAVDASHSHDTIMHDARRVLLRVPMLQT